jgi:hypothetical protein
MNPRFVEIARDPTLIPGVYEHCDQWCAYCPHTRRCLAHRCRVDYAKSTGRDPAGGVFTSLAELVQFTRDIAGATGQGTPELDVLLQGPQTEGPLAAAPDPLTDMAFEYAAGVAVMAAGVESHLPPARVDAPRPLPLDVLMWFQGQIVIRVQRAITSAKQAAAGEADRLRDAHGCAKVALIAIGRSRQALREIAPWADDRAIAELQRVLEMLEAGLDQRFPKARSFIRPGLDVPVGTM